MIMIKKVTTYQAAIKKHYLLSVEIYFLGILIFRHYVRKVTSEDEEFKDYKIISRHQ